MPLLIHVSLKSTHSFRMKLRLQSDSGTTQPTLKPPPKRKRKPSKNNISQQLEGKENIEPSKPNKRRHVTEGMKAGSDILSTALREEMLNPP